MAAHILVVSGVCNAKLHDFMFGTHPTNTNPDLHGKGKQSTWVCVLALEADFTLPAAAPDVVLPKHCIKC